MQADRSIHATDSFLAMLIRLATTPEYKQKARESVLGLLSRQIYMRPAVALVRTLVQLDPMREDKWQARDSLLRVVRHRDLGDQDQFRNWLIQRKYSEVL